MPAFLLPIIAKVLPFLRQYWKFAVGIIGAIVLALLFHHWIAKHDAALVKKGFDQAQAQYTAAINAANAKVTASNTALQTIATAAGAKTDNQTQKLKVDLTPILGKIHDEIASNPIYRSCVATGGLFGDAQAERARVDTAISASAPKAN